MNNKSAIILIMHLFLFGNTVHCQEDFLDVTKQLEVSEPTAAGLSLYNSYPVNYSTGLPTIEVPLYTIKSGSLELPIKLKYHGGGIKVNQDASWVGLGWDLFCGGTITRKINGKDDKNEDLINIPKSSDIWSLIQSNQITSGSLDNYMNASHMPDEYTYVINGASGMFITGNNGKPLEIPFTNNKIEDLGGRGKRLITTDGVAYSFSDTESTQLKPAHSNIPTYISSWHLSQINAINESDVITITYQPGGTYISSSVAQSAGIKRTQKQSTISYSTIPIIANQTKQVVESRKPDVINFRGGRVRFFLGDRSDVYQHNTSEKLKKLDAIVIEKKMQDGTYNRQIKYVFEYSYFTTGGSTESNNMRLKLDKVWKHGKTDDAAPICISSFNYLNADQLPRKNSFSQDFWGYYNGKENATLIPGNYFTSGERRKLQSIAKANRSVDETFMKAGTLQKITHATKGETVFNWEVNRYGNDTPIVSVDEEKNIGVSLTYSDDPTHDVVGKLDPDFFPELLEKTHTFTIDKSQTVILRYALSKQNTTDYGHKKYDKGSIGLYHGSSTIKEVSTFYADNSVIEEYIDLPAGEYYVKALRNCANVYAYISISYYETDINTNKNHYPIGGLRIKSIENFDKGNKLISKQEFEYINPETTHSSGVLTNNRLKTFTNSTKTISSENTGNGEYKCINVSTTSTMVHSREVTGAYANTVNYQYVQVYDIGKDGKKGYTQYEFEVGEDGYYGESIPLISNSWNRGQLKCKSVFKSENNTFTEIENTRNYYNIDTRNSTITNGFKMFRHTNILSYCPETANDPDLHIKNCYEPVNYSYATKWKHLDSTEVVQKYGEYDVMSKTIYHYDNPDYAHSNKQVSFNSKNEKETTIRKYSLDYPIIYNQDGTVVGDKMTKGIGAMQQANMVNVPIESYHLSGTKTKANLRTYDLVATNGMVLPNKFLKLKHLNSTQFTPSSVDHGNNFILDSNYDDALIVDKYDLNGNILQYHKEYNTSSSFIWSYSNQYIIAKAENIDYDTLMAAINKALQIHFSEYTIETFLESLKDLTSEQEKQNLATFNKDLRDLQELTNTLITTYTYDPLIGMTSQTDPNGRTTYYEYDGFGRLKFVRDQDKNIIKKHEYNYATQTSN